MSSVLKITRKLTYNLYLTSLAAGLHNESNSVGKAAFLGGKTEQNNVKQISGKAYLSIKAYLLTIHQSSWLLDFYKMLLWLIDYYN